MSERGFSGLPEDENKDGPKKASEELRKIDEERQSAGPPGRQLVPHGFAQKLFGVIDAGVGIQSSTPESNDNIQIALEADVRDIAPKKVMELWEAGKRKIFDSPVPQGEFDIQGALAAARSMLSSIGWGIYNIDQNRFTVTSLENCNTQPLVWMLVMYDAERRKKLQENMMYSGQLLEKSRPDIRASIVQPLPITPEWAGILFVRDATLLEQRHRGQWTSLPSGINADPSHAALAAAEKLAEGSLIPSVRGFQNSLGIHSIADLQNLILKREQKFLEVIDALDACTHSSPACTPEELYMRFDIYLSCFRHCIGEKIPFGYTDTLKGIALKQWNKKNQERKKVTEPLSKNLPTPEEALQLYKQGAAELLKYAPEPNQKIMFTDEPNPEAILMQVKNLVDQSSWVGIIDARNGQGVMPQPEGGRSTNPAFAVATPSYMNLKSSSDGLNPPDIRVLHLSSAEGDRNIFCFPIQRFTPIGAGINFVQMLAPHSAEMHRSPIVSLHQSTLSKEDNLLRQYVGIDVTLSSYFGDSYHSAFNDVLQMYPDWDTVYAVMEKDVVAFEKMIRSFCTKIGMPMPLSLMEAENLVAVLFASLAFHYSRHFQPDTTKQTEFFKLDIATMHSPTMSAKRQEVARRLIDGEKNEMEKSTDLASIVSRKTRIEAEQAEKINPQKLAQDCLATARMELSNWRGEPLPSFDAEHKKAGNEFGKKNTAASRLLVAAELLASLSEKQPQVGAPVIEIRAYLQTVIDAIRNEAFPQKETAKLKRPEAQELFLASSLMIQPYTNRCFSFINWLYALIRDLSEEQPQMRDHLYQLAAMIGDHREMENVEQPKTKRGTWLHRESVATKNALITCIPAGQNDHSNLLTMGTQLSRDYVDSHLNVSPINAMITKGAPISYIRAQNQGRGLVFFQADSPESLNVGIGTSSGKARCVRDQISLEGTVCSVRIDGMIGDTTYPCSPSSKGSMSQLGRDMITQYAPYLYEEVREHLEVACPELLALKGEILKDSVIIRNSVGLHIIFPRQLESRVHEIIKSKNDDSVVQALFALYAPYLSNAAPDQWASVTLPMIEELEKDLLTEEDANGRFEGGSGGQLAASGGGGPGVAVEGEKSAADYVHTPTKRLRIVRNQILRNRCQGVYLWDVGGQKKDAQKKKNFAEVNDGHFVVISLKDRQIIIRDEPETSYVLPGVRHKDEIVGNINASWLRSQGKPLCCVNSAQFADVVHQAINMPVSSILTSNHGSVEALIAMQGDVIRIQISNLLLRVNELRAEREQPPLVEQELTASRVHHEINSGKAPEIPRCGQTFLRELAYQANSNDVDSYQEQKRIFEEIRNRLFAVPQETQE